MSPSRAAPLSPQLTLGIQIQGYFDSYTQFKIAAYGNVLQEHVNFLNWLSWFLSDIACASLTSLDYI